MNHREILFNSGSEETPLKNDVLRMRRTFASKPIAKNRSLEAISEGARAAKQVLLALELTWQAETLSPLLPTKRNEKSMRRCAARQQ